MKLEVLESFKAFTACFVEISSTLSGTIYQLSMAQENFGDKVLDLKWRCCCGQLSLFPMLTVSSSIIVCTLLLMMSKAGCTGIDINTSWMLKPGHQTFVVPYSTDNRSNCSWFGKWHITIVNNVVLFSRIWQDVHHDGKPEPDRTYTQAVWWTFW